MKNYFFGPAIRLMNRLKYAQKFTFLGALSLIPSILFALLAFSFNNEATQFIERELNVVEKGLPINDLAELNGYVQNATELGVRLIEKKNLSQQDSVSLVTTLPALIQAKLSKVDKTVQDNFKSNDLLKNEIGVQYQETVQNVDRFLNQPYFKMGVLDSTRLQSDYYLAGEKAEASIVRLYEAYHHAQIPLVNIPFKMRITKLSYQRVMVSLFIFVLFIISIYFFMGFYYSLSRSVYSLNRISMQLMRGETESAIHIESRDELAAVGIALNNVGHAIVEQNKELEENKKRQELLYQQQASLNQQLQKSNTQIQEQQAHLIQSEKMSSLGQMVAGIAHEMNTPLGYVTNNVNIIRKRFNSQNDVLEKMLEVQELLAQDKYEEAFDKMQIVNSLPNTKKEDFHNSVERTDRLFSAALSGLESMANLVKGMRNFSRLDEAEMKKSDINEGLKSTLLMIGHLIKDKNIQINAKYGEIPQVDCHPAQLNQVFLNLVTNAIQALEEKETGIIQITTSVKNEYIQVTVSDNGNGIPEKVRSRIFDPFFTTKPVGQGTGLGLSISYDIIKKHNGTISFRTADGVGTTFIVNIPITEFREEVEKKQYANTSGLN